MDSSTRTPLSEVQLVAAFERQCRFISRSAELVVGGDPDEVVRVAVALRVLFHDTKQSHSILEQLGWKEKIDYVDSLRPLEAMPGLSLGLSGTDSAGNRVEAPMPMGLVGQHHTPEGTIGYHPCCLADSVAEKTLNFSEWWGKKNIAYLGAPTFSRWDLVGTMANQDGGAHVDPRGTSDVYDRFKTRGAGSFSIPWDGPGMATGAEAQRLIEQEASYPGDAATPSVVQVAWEAIESFNRSDFVQGELKRVSPQ
jgi:hypothetical protein